MSSEQPRPTKTSSRAPRSSERPSTPQRKRRWLQFSLRAVLVLFVLAAIFFSWVHTEIGRARTQRLAVEAILEGGGSVSYIGTDYTSSINNGTKSDRLIPRSTWWTEILGEDLRLRARFISIGEVENSGLGAKATTRRRETLGDHNLQFVSDLRGVETLDAMGRTVTDEGLLQLRELPDLKSFYLRHAALTRRGMTVLRRMPKLEFLQMQFCPVTDEVFAEIGQVTTLKHLDMTQSHITGEGFGELKELINLETLILDEVDFDGVGCRYLAKLPSLTKLSLASSSVNDEGAAAIAKIAALQELNLAMTPITDIGLMHLANMPNLKTVLLSQGGYSKVTEAGRAAFLDARPDVTLSRGRTAAGFNPAWLRREWAEK